MSSNQLEEPCSNEPRIFIGQLPMNVTFEGVGQLFGQYGTIKQHRVTPSTNQQAANKGYAMILYDSWASAEAALEQNGQNPFGGTKAMVVKIAQPTRGPDGSSAPPIAPRKLFVGQIPQETTDDEVKELLSQFGEIVEYGRLQKKGTKAADCAFVQLAKWAQCEQAINELNNKRSFDGQKPITVKFANFHIRDNQDSYSSGGRQNFNKRPYQEFNNNSGGNRYQPEGRFSQQQQGYSKRQYTNNQGGSYPSYNQGSTTYQQQPNFPQKLQQPPQQQGYGTDDFQSKQSFAPSYQGQQQYGNGLNVPSYQGNQPQQFTRNQPPPFQNQNQFPASSNYQSQNQFSAQSQNPQLNDPSQTFNRNQNRGGNQQLADNQNKEWKLFVGQIPYELNEYEVWQEFSRVGDILDVAVLRQPDGRSRGCAFVTFVDRGLAEIAINMYHQQSPFPTSTRPLVVKIAG